MSQEKDLIASYEEKLREKDAQIEALKEKVAFLEETLKDTNERMKYHP